MTDEDDGETGELTLLAGIMGLVSMALVATAVLA